MEPETLSAIERAELALSIVGGNKTDQLEVAFIRARWLYLTGDIVAAVEKLREIHAERKARWPSTPQARSRSCWASR